MNEGNSFGSNLPDEIEYNAPTPKNEGPVGVSAPVLDDIDYVAPTAKKGGPQGVAAPVLDDMAAYTPSSGEKKGAPTGVSAPVLDDNVPYTASKPQKKIMTDEEIIAGFTPDQLETYNKLPEQNRQKVLDLRRQQLGVEAPPPVVTAPVLDEDNYTPPPKKEEPPQQPAEPLKAPVLDEAPEAPKYVPKFVDEDLERAKREGAKKAVSSALVSDQKDSKESLRMMLQLKEERQAELAAKGFKITIILAVIGIIGAVTFYLLYSGKLGLSYKDGMSGAAKILEEASMYISLAAGVSAVLLMTGVSFFKSIASLVHLLSGLVQIFPGCVMITQHNGSMGLVAALYAVSIICTVAVFFMISGSEAVGLYFKRND